MELVTPGIITDLVTGGIVYGEFFRGLDGKIYLSQNQVAGYNDNAWLYQFAEDISTTSYTQNSLPLYGSSNSSMLEGGFPSQVVKCYGSETGTNNTYSRKLGFKRYELSDHLGNVRVVITDKRFLEDENNDNLYDQTDILHADIVMANDYYPFGMISRSANATGEYMFGFQGQEHDYEWTHHRGSHLNYKYRVHDARIGRFLSIDPLTAKYPHNSPYAFSENRVIDGIELEGLEFLRTASSLEFYPDYDRNDGVYLGFNGSVFCSYYPHLATMYTMQQIDTRSPQGTAMSTRLSITRGVRHTLNVVATEHKSNRKYHYVNGKKVLKRSKSKVKGSAKPVAVQSVLYTRNHTGVSAAAELLMAAIDYRKWRTRLKANTQEYVFYNNEVDAAFKTNVIVGTAVMADVVPDEFVNSKDLTTLYNLVLSEEFWKKPGISPDLKDLALFIYENREELLKDGYPYLEGNPLKDNSGEWKSNYNSWEGIWVQYR